MPRHPPIALKTLDRSHCQCPSRDLEEIVARTRSCAEPGFNGIGTKRPASRDRFEGAVRQTHHMREIERLPRQITTLTAHEVRTNLLFTMSNRTGGKARCSPQTLFSNDFFSDTFISTRHLFLPWRRSDNPCGLREWWSRTGSNRRHPACKAGALPAELRPLIIFPTDIEEIRQSLRIAKWWAWEDLNLRPHAYQARALTN